MYWLVEPSNGKRLPRLMLSPHRLGAQALAKTHGGYFSLHDEASTTYCNSTMLLPYQIYIPIEEKKKEIQKKKRNKNTVSERDAFVSRATFHILNSVKIIAENEAIDLNTKEGIDKAIERAIKYIEEVVQDEMKRRGELYTHDKFFKEIPTNKIIREHILAKYP